MPFSWQPSTARYRESGSGRFVKEQQIREALDAVIDVQAVKMRSLTQDLIDGRVSLPEWQLRSMQTIKLAHLDGMALANGGWKQIDPAELKWAAERIRTQYTFLANYAQEIAGGLEPSLSRSAMYAEAGRVTHREAQHKMATDRGMEQERNHLGAADNCSGCIAQTGRGWVPLGSLVPVGSRDCLSNCSCVTTFRKVRAA